MSTEIDPAQLPTPDPEPAGATATAPPADSGDSSAPAQAEAAPSTEDKIIKTPSAEAQPDGEQSTRRGGRKAPEPIKKVPKSTGGAPNSKSASSGSKAPVSGAPKKPGRPSKSGISSGGAPASADGSHEDKNLKSGDIVLARLKGYPPWPARIVAPEDVPRDVAAAKKSSSVYAVQYFPAGDFSWLSAKDINPLKPSQIKDFLSTGHRNQSGSLAIAYQTAQDPSQWMAKQAEIMAAKAAEEQDVDELEDDEDGTAGKRKKSTGSKPKKKAKTEKADTTEAAPKSKTSKPAAKLKTDSKPAPKSEAKPAEPAADDDPLASDPECIKVKDWRHKLQRAFLGKGMPLADEMDTYDQLFKTIENYKDMTIDALTYSKIGKVMKKIATLEQIPKNEELKITDRASKLMHEWQEFISKNDPQANGDAKENGA